MECLNHFCLDWNLLGRGRTCFLICLKFIECLLHIVEIVGMVGMI